MREHILVQGTFENTERLVLAYRPVVAEMYRYRTVSGKWQRSELVVTLVVLVRYVGGSGLMQESNVFIRVRDDIIEESGKFFKTPGG